MVIHMVTRAVRSPVEVVKVAFMRARYTHPGQSTRGAGKIESNSCRFGTVIMGAWRSVILPTLRVGRRPRSGGGVMSNDTEAHDPTVAV